MKKVIKYLSAVLSVIMLVCLFGCGGKTSNEGEKSFTLIVETPDGISETECTATETTLGEFLINYGIAQGETGQYGLYITTVYGRIAENGAYWAFYIDDVMASTGVDGENIRDGAVYKLVYTESN